MYTLKAYNNKEWSFDSHFDDSTPRIEKTINQSRTQVETFGKYPMIYYAGATNFLTYNLSTVFLGQSTQTPLEEYNDFLAAVEAHRPWEVTDGFGRTILADVSLLSVSESKLVSDTYHNYIEVTVTVTQIGEV